MKLHKERKDSPERMSDQERQEYLKKLDREISNWSYQDRYKYEFSKDFVNNLQFFKAEDGDEIQIGPVNRKILEYFIFSILIEYDRAVHES
jgi:hypothetical protein